MDGHGQGRTGVHDLAQEVGGPWGPSAESQESEWARKRLLEIEARGRSAAERRLELLENRGAPTSEKMQALQEICEAAKGRPAAPSDAEGSRRVFQSGIQAGKTLASAEEIARARAEGKRILVPKRNGGPVRWGRPGE